MAKEAQDFEPHPEGILTSWKEVASFLGVTPRTAQKWETSAGLPVHRLPGQKGRIWADSAELRLWRSNPPVNGGGRSAWRIGLTAAAAALAIGAILMAGIAYRRANPAAGSPAAYRIEGSTLIVTDAANREVFRQQFPSLCKERYADPAWSCFLVGDLDGKPGLETLFVYFPATRTKDGTRLICYGADGQERWRFTPGGIVRDAIEVFSGTYLIEDIAVVGFPPDVRIVVSSHQELRYPNQLAALDANGRLLGEYWHSGHLPRMLVHDLDRDGAAEVVLAGVSNSYKAATLVALAIPAQRIASREPAGGCYQLQDFALAREKARLIFPRTCLNRRLAEFNFASYAGLLGNGNLRVRTLELLPDVTSMVHYDFSPGLSLLTSAWDVGLRDLHHRLRAEGKLDHDLSDRETAGPVKLLDLTPR